MVRLGTYKIVDNFVHTNYYIKFSRNCQDKAKKFWLPGVVGCSVMAEILSRHGVSAKQKAGDARRCDDGADRRAVLYLLGALAGEAVG